MKINEAAYNTGSPITLLSEYQIRENEYIVDSVATKHRTSLDTYGTQRIILNEVICIPFEDRGGLMGCKILPIEDGDVDKVDPKYDIIELTSSQKWIPAQFHTNTAQIKEDLVLDHPNMNVVDNDATNESFGKSSVDDFLHILDYDALVQPHLEARILHLWDSSCYVQHCDQTVA